MFGGVVKNFSPDDFPAADFGKLTSYGEVIRDGKPAVVLIDFGCSNDVWKTHYAR